MPQGPLRKAIVAEAGIDDDDELGLLTWLGEDLPGAVRVVHESNAPVYRRSAGRPDFDSRPSTLRVSLAGMQWKVGLSRTARGLTLPVRGESAEWMAKFQGREFPRLVQVEYATMRWAAACGLSVPDVELVDARSIQGLPASIPTGDGSALLIRRFDRTGTERTHQEDFAQVLDRPDQFGGSFEEMAAFVASESPTDVAEFIGRVAFMLGSGNADAHLKNWSVVYPDGRRGRLSPAYDQIATVVYPELPRVVALKLHSRGDFPFASIVADDFAPMAHALSLSLDDLVERLTAALRSVRTAFGAVESDLSEEERARIQAHLSSLKI
ncbi:MAG: HipA domain-containing protein [Archangium sp.]|nr:HipA domain-containing protein [Archangium sp.]MDP3152217.1 HipA domain-containing protein [Archangium sp.]MDP3571062.1 HipA domain-containing protein [Archangium sp.]